MGIELVSSQQKNEDIRFGIQTEKGLEDIYSC